MEPYIRTFLVILTPLIAWLIWSLRSERNRYRKQWVQAAERAAKEVTRCIQLNTEIHSNAGITAYWEKRCAEHCKEIMALKLKANKCAQELTQISETVDALLHGDRCCVFSHRFHKQDGDGKCPHCGAVESETMQSDDIPF